MWCRPVKGFSREVTKEYTVMGRRRGRQLTSGAGTADIRAYIFGGRNQAELNCVERGRDVMIEERMFSTYLRLSDTA